MADSSRISVAVEEVASASADPDPPTLAEGCARRSRWVAAFVACATLLMAGAVGVAGERRVEQGGDGGGGGGGGWVQAGRPDPAERLVVTFAVKQSNLEELERRLLAVSEPSSPEYGMHMGRDAVDELVAPAAASLAAVHGMLGQHSVDVDGCTTTGNLDMLRCSLSVQTLEQMLQTEYHRYVHPATGIVAIRTQRYSLPASVAPHLDFVSPTLRLPPTVAAGGGVGRRQQRRRADEISPGATNNPASLRRRYGLPEPLDMSSPQARAGALSQGFTGFASSGPCEWASADLTAFWDAFGPTPDPVPAIRVTGSEHSSEARAVGTLEASLDVQYITSLAGPGVQTSFWNFAGHAADNAQDEPWLTFLETLASTPDADVPLLFSISYGESEAAEHHPYLDRCDVEFKKAGMRGVSLLVASGDFGVNDGDGICAGRQLSGQWPGASPWVTAVGGTTGGRADCGGSECVWADSGGGFSTHWARPTWQDSAVEHWVNEVRNDNQHRQLDEVVADRGGDVPSAGLYNSSMAGFPDLVAQGVNYEVVVSGTVELVDGTSAATPTVAAAISLLNAARLADGKPRLGFLNPLLYANPNAFDDVTVGATISDVPGSGYGYGENEETPAGTGCGPVGYSAAAGWDPASGLGIMNYPKLLAAVRALPQ